MLYMILQFFHEIVVCFGLIFSGKNNSSLDNHTADRVGNACNGTFYNGRMRHQCILNFEWANTITRAFDNIIRATYKPEVTFLIAPCHVTCMINAVVPSLLGLFFIAIITFEQAEWLLVAYADADLSLFTVFAFRTVLAQQSYVVLRVRLSH